MNELLNSMKTTVDYKHGDSLQALALMELWKARSPSPDAVQKIIDDVRHKTSSLAPAAPPPQTPGQAP